MITNVKELASEIAKREGKKSQVKIGDIREILKIIVKLQIEWIDADEAHMAMPIDSPLDLLLDKAMDKRNKRERKNGSNHQNK